MRRIGLAVALALSLFVAPLAAEGQQAGKIARIGILNLLPPETSQGFAVLRQGLRDLGYLEGQNIVLEYRWPKRPEQLSTSVAELLQLKVDIIVAADERTAVAATRATRDIPIVMRGPFMGSREGHPRATPWSAPLVRHLPDAAGLQPASAGPERLASRTAQQVAAAGGGTSRRAWWSSADRGQQV
jgi:putative ABC transport system substrate-binding protein